LLYRDGRGVGRDNVLAYAWLGLAAEGADAAALRARAAEARASLEERMSAAAIAAGRIRIDQLRQTIPNPAPDPHFSRARSRREPRRRQDPFLGLASRTARSWRRIATVAKAASRRLGQDL
jgi:hypothetical protein